MKLAHVLTLLSATVLFCVPGVLPAQQSSGTGSMDAQLLDAAQAGNTAAVQSLLQRGANIEAKDNSGSTALIWAAVRGQTGIVKVLLDKGANIEAKRNDGETALIWAAEAGKSDTIRLLRDRGANVEARSRGGNTALIYAAGRGYTDAVKLLLAKGADIEAKGDGGDSALIDAAREGDTDTVKLLLDRGANIEARSSGGNTALMSAAHSYHTTDTAKLLLDRGANIEATNDGGDTALIQAVEHPNIDVVKLLLDEGASTEVKGRLGYTALDDAIREAEYSADTNGPKWGASPVYADIVQLIQQERPRNTFKQYLSSFHELHDSHRSCRTNAGLCNFDDSSLREPILRIAASLHPPTAIPEEAHQALVQAGALLQQRNADHTDVQQAVADLRRALILAPWYPEAYYNLALALEISGEYDEAAKQLNYYLELNPSSDDTRAAKDLIYKLTTEKDAATRKQQEHERELAFKYVSGGAQRLRVSDSPSNWNARKLHGVFELYGLTVPEEEPYYANVFKIPKESLNK